jgi:uncharacterized OsmC-like protein
MFLLLPRRRRQRAGSCAPLLWKGVGGEVLFQTLRILSEASARRFGLCGYNLFLASPEILATHFFNIFKPQSQTQPLMNASELKALQAPLKEKYKSEPASAIITLKAQGKIGEGISCKVETGRAFIDAGLHPATGGTGLLACSGDLLLEALVACAGVTLRAVATAIEVEIKDGTIKAEGDLDFKGTLGVSKEVPVGFSAIRLSFDLDTNATAEQMASLSKLTERYCVVYQTLVKGVPVETRFQNKQ